MYKMILSEGRRFSIVQNFVLLLVEHVDRKKKNFNKRKEKKKKKRLMRPLSIEPVTSLVKCRVIFYWVTLYPL